MENWDLSFATFLSSFWLLDLAEDTTESMQVSQRLYEASHVMVNKYANGFNLCVYRKISSPSKYIKQALYKAVKLFLVKNISQCSQYSIINSILIGFLCK